MHEPQTSSRAAHSEGPLVIYCGYHKLLPNHSLVAPRHLVALVWYGDRITAQTWSGCTDILDGSNMGCPYVSIWQRTLCIWMEYSIYLWRVFINTKLSGMCPIDCAIIQLVVTASIHTRTLKGWVVTLSTQWAVQLCSPLSKLDQLWVAWAPSQMLIILYLN